MPKFTQGARDLKLSATLTQDVNIPECHEEVALKCSSTVSRSNGMKIIQLG